MRNNVYSRYDKIKREHFVLLRNRTLLLFSISLILSIAVYIITHINIIGFGFLFYSFLFILSTLTADKILNFFSQVYNTKRQKEFELQTEIYKLKDKMSSIIESIEKRGKNQQFKRAYDFTGKKINEFEHVLAIAMHHEIKEVWVTVFCKNNTVLKVTATIGSARQCRPSEDVRNWRGHVLKLGCDEIRNYHNHPGNNNYTAPSPNDLLSNLSLRNCLLEMKDSLRTFIVFWNDISEYRILEYYDNGKTEMSFYFDVSSH